MAVINQIKNDLADPNTDITPLEDLLQHVSKKALSSFLPLNERGYHYPTRSYNSINK